MATGNTAWQWQRNRHRRNSKLKAYFRFYKESLNFYVITRSLLYRNLFNAIKKSEIYFYRQKISI